MLLLLTDTSAKQGSVALARVAEGANEIDFIDSATLDGGAFSAQLVPQVAALLAKHGLNKAEIGAFIVVSGPGSFTGLRVGLAAIKALAEILQKPIVPISRLQMVALAPRKQGRVLAVLDAGRGEVYAGEYEIAADAAHLRDERLLSRENFLQRAHAMLVSTPDAALARIAQDAGLPVFNFESVTGEMIAALGWSKLRSGETVTPDQLEANYIRRSDAEIFARPNI